MHSITNLAKDVISKGEGLERERVLYDSDAIQHLSCAYKVEKTQIKRVKLPTMDSPPISPYIELRNAEHESQTTDRRLAKKRKEFLVKQKYLAAQWMDLQARERALRDNFIIFSKFLKTNLEKRERAMKKLQIDTENVQNRTEELEQLRCKYNSRREEFLIMKREIQKHSIYQWFLENVIYLADGEFKDIEDLPKRMEVLLLAKEKLQIKQADQLRRLECSKKVIGQFVESEILQIIGLTTTLASLQYKYDDAVKRTIELDNMVVNLKSTMLKYHTDLSANKESIENLYQQICLKHNIMEKHRKKKVVDQLLEINHSIMESRRIYDIMRRKSRKASKNVKTSR